jgi:hypothetical protein
MGCDIHAWIERRQLAAKPGPWEMVLDLDDAKADTRPARRHYGRFAKLAGVRGDGPEAKGIPEDVSAEVSEHSENMGSDGHSHSWNDFDEALSIWRETEPSPTGISQDRNIASWQLFGYVPDAGYEYRIVYFFDN